MPAPARPDKSTDTSSGETEYSHIIMSRKPTRRQKTRAWYQAHVKDTYVRQAQQDGYRSRAVYKLKEIDEKDQLFKPGQTVVDLGAAPGGWSEFARERMGASGRIVALDLLPMAPVAGVEFIQGDFTETAILEQVLAVVGTRSADLVISDMAPNLSGIASADQAGAIYLAELALDFADKALAPGGVLLVKTFQGEGFPELRQAMLTRFKRVLSRKPKASRPQSREIYLLGRD